MPELVGILPQHIAGRRVEGAELAISCVPPVKIRFPLVVRAAAPRTPGVLEAVFPGFSSPLFMSHACSLPMVTG